MSEIQSLSNANIQPLRIAKEAQAAKMGSHSVAIDGNPPINLAKLGMEHIPFQGFTSASKIESSRQGLEAMAQLSISRLVTLGTSSNVGDVVRSLNTMQNYLERQESLVTGRELGDSDVLKAFAPLIHSLDNTKLCLLYQGMISRGMEDLKGALEMEMYRQGAERLAEPQMEAVKALYSNIFELEGLVVQEISERVSMTQLPPEALAERQSALDKYMIQADEHGQAPNRIGDDWVVVGHESGDEQIMQLDGQGGGRENNPVDVPSSSSIDRGMSVSNLAHMVDKAAGEAVHSQTQLQDVQTSFEQHGVNQIDIREVGDLLRASELTINTSLEALLGLYDGQDPDNPPIFDPQYKLQNIFEIKPDINHVSQDERDYMEFRNEVEKGLFPEYNENPIGRERPIYGALNHTGRWSGGAGVNNSYGGAVVVLKSSVKHNSTYTIDDTFFMPPVHINEETKSVFLGSLLSIQNEFSPEAQAALNNEKSALRAGIEQFFAKYDGDSKATAKRFLVFVDTLSVKLRMAINGKPMNTDRLKNMLLQATCKPEELAQASVTFDNMEQLLGKIKPGIALGYALMTIRKRQNPGQAVCMPGTNYIEAQIHQPVYLQKDVAEIRIQEKEVRRVFTTYFEGHLDKVHAYMQKMDQDAPEAAPHSEEDAINALVVMKTQAALERFSDIQKTTGLKITLVDFNDSGQKKINREIFASRDANEAFLREKMAPEITQAILAKLATQNGQNELLKKILASGEPTDFFALKEMWGESLENLPQTVRDFVLKATREALGSQVMYSSEIDVTIAICNRGAEALQQALRVEKELNSLEFKDEGQKTRFRDSLYKEPFPAVNSKKLANYIKSNYAVFVNTERLNGDFNALADDILSFREDAEEVRSLLHGMSIFDGAARGKIIGKISQELSKIASNFDMNTSLTREAVLRQLGDHVVLPFMDKKIALLKHLRELEFKDEKEMLSMQSWVLNAGALTRADELDMIHRVSTQFADALENAVLNGQPITPGLLGQIARETTPEIMEYINKLTAEDPINKPGPDDIYAEFRRMVSVALGRLKDSRLTDGQLQNLIRSLRTPDVQSAFLAADSLANLRKEGTTKPVDIDEQARLLHLYVIGLTINDTLDSFWKIPGKFQTAHMDLEMIRGEDRQALAALFPKHIEALNEKFPIGPKTLVTIGSMPGTQGIANLPQNQEQRERFLVSMLEHYREHERTFDRGHSWHGRTHATRAFIFATVMGNFLADKGISVDMNALCFGIAGHDAGRRSNGNDNDEEGSSAMTQQMVATMYPGAADHEWTRTLGQNIIHTRVNNWRPATLEAYLLNSADSLDYGRVGDIDANKFPFLREPILTQNGLVNSLPKMREMLIKEATELCKMTSPTVANFDRTMELYAEMSTSKDKRGVQEKINKLQEENKAKEIWLTEHMSNQEILDSVKSIIRDNPDTFPLLNKYYH